MDKRLIEALRPRAETLLSAIEYRFNGTNEIPRTSADDFKKWKDGGKNLWYELNSHDEIVFFLQNTGNKRQYVKFSGIKPVNATDVVINPPIIKDRKVIDASTHTVTNSSQCDVSRTYEVEKSTETNVSHEVGVQVTLGLRSMMRFGTDSTPIGGEVEITAEVQSHYDKTMSKTETSSISTTTEVSIPAGKSVTFSTNRSVAKYEQEMQYTANIDHKVEVVLDRHNGGYGDRNHWVEFENWPTALRILRGGGYKNDDYQDYVNAFKKQPIADWEVDILNKAKGVPIIVKIEFDEATVTDVALQ